MSEPDPKLTERIEGETVDVEHVFTPVYVMPPSIKRRFNHGACVIFADEEFLAAIPANKQQTKQLDQMLLGSKTAYLAYRDELCKPEGYEVLSAMFIEAMGSEQHTDEVKEMAKNN